MRSSIPGARQLAPAAALLALPLVFTEPALAQTLVDNINAVPGGLEPSSVPFGYDPFGAELVFTAVTVWGGREAWITDGTEAGTRQLIDLWPGSGSGDARYWTEITSGIWLFAGRTPEHGFELWRTDGTEAGTQLVSDILPGTQSSGISYLTGHNGEAYFFAAGPGQGRALWKSDGTEAGTVLVSDLSVGGAPAFTNGTEALLSTPAGLFFTSNNSNSWRLWVTDGTPGGAVLLTEQQTSFVNGPASFREFNGKAYFEADSLDFGEELWVSDGTPAGTFVLADIAPGSGDSGPRDLTVFNGELFFTAFNQAAGRELWKTDGTSVGTVQVTDVIAGNPPFLQSNPTGLRVVGNFLAFNAFRSDVGREAWVTDGSVGNWTLLADFAPGTASSDPFYFTELNGEVLCRASTAATGSELFATDGTPAGTRLVKDFTPGPDDTFPYSFTVLNGELILTVDEPVFGEEPWISDGTTAGTRILANISKPALDGDSYPVRPVALGDRALYLANDGVHGVEPWFTDGTAQGTGLLIDANPGAAWSGSGQPFEWNGLAYLALFDPAFGTELWTSDGTPQGTQLLLDINPGIPSSSPEFLGVFDGELYFRAVVASVGTELFATDGTVAGTRLVVDLYPGGNSTPRAFTVHDGRAYFQAFTPSLGTELWSTDGTAGGTQLVVDLWPGTQSGLIQTEMASFDGRLFFRGQDGTAGQELYVTDGTSGGTQLVADLNPGGSSFPNGMQVLGDRLVLLADSGQAADGQQLWAIDAATLTPTQLTTLDPPPIGDGVNGPVRRAGDAVYVLYDDQTVGVNQVLVRSDGTRSGTFVVTALDLTAQFKLFSQPNSIATSDGRLVFGGNDGLFGHELWVTDGSAAGTVRLTDVNPGGADGQPAWLVRVGNQILFAANDGQIGIELHQLPLVATGGWIAEPYGEGCAGSAGVPTIGSSGAAKVGSPFGLELGDALPGSAAFLFLGLSTAVLDAGGGCRVHLASPELIGALPTSATGALSVPFAIPAEPVLIGLELWTQFLVADPGGALGGGALSPALEVVIGA